MPTKLMKLIMAEGYQFFEDNQPIYGKVKKELMERKMKQIMEQEYQLDRLGKFYTGMKNLITENKLQIKEKLAEKHNNGYVWITINPKPSIKLEYFRKKVQKLVKRNLFTESQWVYEQRGIDEASSGSGFHAHILCKRNLNYKPFKVTECIQNTCKDLVKNKKCQKTLNIQHIGSDFMKDKLVYMLDQKTGEGKDKKQIIDKIFRKNNNLEIIYKYAKKNEEKNCSKENN